RSERDWSSYVCSSDLFLIDVAFRDALGSFCWCFRCLPAFYISFAFGNSGLILRSLSAFFYRSVAHGLFCKAGILCGALFHIIPENRRIYSLCDILAVAFGIFRILCILNILCVISGLCAFSLFRSRCLSCLNLVFLVHALLDLLQGILHLFNVITLLRDLLKQGNDRIHLFFAEIHVILYS